MHSLVFLGNFESKKFIRPQLQGMSTTSGNNPKGVVRFVCSMEFSCKAPAHTISTYLFTSTGLITSTASNNCYKNVAKIACLSTKRANQENTPLLTFGLPNIGNASA
jgi:hypothetical protein